MRSLFTKPYTYVLVLPGFLLYVIFFILPSLFGVWLSFSHISQFSLGTIRYAGWSNYVNVLSAPYLNAAVINSFISRIFESKAEVTQIFKNSLFLACCAKNGSGGSIFHLGHASEQGINE